MTTRHGSPGGIVLAIAVSATLTACSSDPIPTTAGAAMGVDSAIDSVLLRAVHLEAPPGGQYPAGADATVRLTLIDEGPSPETLESVWTPLADRVEIHWDRGCDGDSEAVPGLPLLPTNGDDAYRTDLARPFDPYHLRLVDLRRDVLAGTVVPLVFTFSVVGRHETAAYVLPRHANFREPNRRCVRSRLPPIGEGRTGMFITAR